MTTPDEEQTTSRTTRATTKLEIAVGFGVVVNFAAVVWFAATMDANLKQVQVAVAELTRIVGAMQSEAPATAVLEYRVVQAEREIQALKAAKR